MALQKIHQINFHGKTIVFENCYFKVLYFKGNKESITFTLDAMSAKDGSSINKIDYVFTPELEGVNFIAQSYLHLKTLPEFAGASDC
jgi:hypothetical protein